MGDKTNDSALTGTPGSIEPTCEWINQEDYWQTQCGDDHCFIADGPKENRYLFCPYCGARIVVSNEKDQWQERRRIMKKPKYKNKQYRGKAKVGTFMKRKPSPARPESAGWGELHEATTDLMKSFTATGPKFDRVRRALKVKPNDLESV